jgi:hypothetical protein
MTGGTDWTLMTRHSVGLVLLSAGLVACEPGRSSKSVELADRDTFVDATAEGDTTAKAMEKEHASEPTIEQVESMINATYLDRIPRTRKQLEVVSFAEKYLKSEKRSLPRQRKYLVDGSSEGAWVVTLLDLELLRQGGRGGGLSVYVDEINGQLRANTVTIGP